MNTYLNLVNISLARRVRKFDLMIFLDLSDFWIKIVFELSSQFYYLQTYYY